MVPFISEGYRFRPGIVPFFSFFLVSGRVSNPRLLYRTEEEEAHPTRRWLAWTVCQDEGSAATVHSVRSIATEADWSIWRQ
ncbi:hypothetical protein Y032_0677g1438 [Ancylostoma ceylanicum]|uniref:Uncharacterized protein n=1 Tax=Ancylostoma ceylanicum TaxID=53326 RepID=A0A016WH14_9BILA|nr:hypothetical protein Y032_0677g1438 [Ancylostoma ceylanicum]